MDDLNGTLLVGLYLSIWAFQYALLEIQTEGPVGWALAAPTWRKKSFVYSKIMNGKELTGYHLHMFFLPLYLLLGVFVFDRYWSGEWRLANWRHMVEILSWYFMMSVNWDFMWFPLNPYFGIKRFCRGQIHWHRKWIGPVPVDYVGALVGAAIFTGVLDLLLGGEDVWQRQGLILGTLLSVSFLAVLLSPAIQRWQRHMRQEHRLTDDWEVYLTADELAELKQLLRQGDEVRERVAELGLRRAQREQLGIPKPPDDAAA